MRNDRLILGLAVTAFLGLYTALVFGFFTADSEARQLYLFLIGLPMTAILIFMPRAALIALALVIYSVRWLYDTLQILPREATWLGDVFILILIIRTVFLIPKRAERLVAIERFILLLLAFAAVSALLNGTNKITLLAGLRMSFRYVLLFVAAIHMNLSGRWVKSYLYFLFALAVIQPLIIWL